MKELRTYVVSTPTGPITLQAETYEVGAGEPPRLRLLTDGRVIGEFIHFAGIWEAEQQTM